MKYILNFNNLVALVVDNLIDELILINYISKIKKSVRKLKAKKIVAISDL